jgi:hypothetical protein
MIFCTTFDHLLGYEYSPSLSYDNISSVKVFMVITYKQSFMTIGSNQKL